MALPRPVHHHHRRSTAAHEPSVLNHHSPPTGEAAPEVIDDYTRLCELFKQSYAEAWPTAKLPKTISKTWHSDMRLMIDRDGRDPEQVAAVIRWLYADPGDIAAFWRTVIRSPGKLRAKWDTMSAQVARERNQKQSRRVENFEDRMARIRRERGQR